MKRLRALVLATRPWSFSMTVISVSLAAAASAGLRPFRWLDYSLVLAGMIMTHGATNLLNDFFDYRHGVDTSSSPTARYRAHPLVEGILSPRGILLAAIVLYGSAAAIGAVLIFRRGLVVSLFAVAGALTSVFYTAGPVKFKHRALGELAVFLMWGPLMMLATSTIITGGWQRALQVALISVPQGLWVALVIFANNLKDISFDRGSGVWTIANLLGRDRALRAFCAGLAAAYAVVAALVALRVIPVWGLAVLLSSPLAVRLASDLMKSPEIPVDADPRTARTGMVFGLLLLGAFLLQALL